jgi:hypothetical protein
LGGPIKKDKTTFLVRIRGRTKLTALLLVSRGLLALQALASCRSRMTARPVNGKIFGGMTGAQGGTEIKPDGSNINPVVNLLNFKLPDGTSSSPLRKL